MRAVRVLASLVAFALATARCANAASLADACELAPRVAVETIMRTTLTTTSYPEVHVCTYRAGDDRQVFLSAWSYPALDRAKAGFRTHVAASARLMHATASALGGYGDEASSVPSFAFMRKGLNVFEVHASDGVTPSEVPLETKRLLRVVLSHAP